MDLQTFIKETLCQISNGMIEAQEALRDSGVRINPPYMYEGGEYLTAEHKSITVRSLQKIDFDIAVTASKKQQAEGKLSIEIFSAKIGGDGSVEKANSSASRISFQLVALLPQSSIEDR